MLDTIELWYLTNQAAVLFSAFDAALALIAWTTGYLTRALTHTSKDTCDH